MKSIIILLLSVALMAGCTKILDKQQENIVTSVITNGQWQVSKYLQAGTDRSSEFNGYSFQFQPNDSIDAIRNNMVERKGSWQVNASARTIYSNFTNAADPLLMLNGTWNIVTTTWTSVEATQTINGTERRLYLQKL